MGGTIIIAARCADGVPDEGGFGRYLATATSIADLTRVDGESLHDRWQAQVLGRVLSRAQVQVYSDGLTDAQARRAFLTPIMDVQQAVEAALKRAGPGATLGVLPDGPMTVARVS